MQWTDQLPTNLKVAFDIRCVAKQLQSTCGHLQHIEGYEAKMLKSMTVWMTFWVVLGICAASPSDRSTGRKLLQDLEGFSASSMAVYLKYVDAKCGDPAKVSGNCLAFKNQLCGTRDTSQVLCTTGKDAMAQFRSASRYTRVGYLKCSLLSATCTTDREGFSISADDKVTATIDPRSLAIWFDYTMKCAGSNFATSGATAAQCANLSGKLCSRADVDCTKSPKYAVILDTKDLKAKRAILRGEFERGLLFFVSRKPVASSSSAAAATKPAAATTTSPGSG